MSDSRSRGPCGPSPPPPADPGLKLMDRIWQDDSLRPMVFMRFYVPSSPSAPALVGLVPLVRITAFGPRPGSLSLEGSSTQLLGNKASVCSRQSLPEDFSGESGTTHAPDPLLPRGIWWHLFPRGWILGFTTEQYSAGDLQGPHLYREGTGRELMGNP